MRVDPHTLVAAAVALALLGGAGRAARSDAPRVFFQESFDDARLPARGWYDGSRFAITGKDAYAGAGCIEYHWDAGATTPSSSGGIRHLFTRTDAVYLRFYLRLSPNWGWSGQSFHPHLTHFMTTENSAYHGPASSHLTLYVEPLNGKLRLAATDMQNADAPHGLTQGPLRGGYNGTMWDSERAVFSDSRWHCVEAMFRLNSVDAKAGTWKPDGQVRGWVDGKLVVERTNVVLRTADFPRMRFNQFLLTPYFGPGLLPHAQTLWIDELAVGTRRIGPLTGPSRSRVKTASGIIEGLSDAATGLRIFRGIPFAAPPVGELRWRPPQPAKSWQGVRKADQFGPRCPQIPVFGDIVSRSDGASEDCLYLNVWTPAKSASERRPVLVYFYGGGFVAGDGSEPRYDGESMARRGIVAVTVNYRLGVFGFLAHPDLTRESPQHASGNYGLLDQAAALRWVRANIAAFGGDPRKVTIGGESAGSFSVSLQMASPLSRGLIAGAIGESGAAFGQTLPLVPRAQVERNGAAFAAKLGAPTAAALRAVPAAKLLEAMRANPFRFGLTVDGYFLPRPVGEIYAAGEQAHVPLLAGWNATEAPGMALLGREPATTEGYARAVRGLYGDRADEVLRAYRAGDDAEVMGAASALASDRFIGYGTWKWIDLHARTSGKPVYRYLYAHPRPGEPGAFHAVEIEYALGNLDRSGAYAWTQDDRKVSDVMLAYFANFVRAGDPNGEGLPEWPAANRGPAVRFMRLDVVSRVEEERHRDRYLLLDAVREAGR